MQFNMVSSNIRFDTPDDGVHCWQGRREILARKVREFGPHLLSTQEGRRPQLQDLEGLVQLQMVDANRHWIDERMYPSLFISPELTPIDSGDIWLSQTPHVPGSKSFGSAFPRLATWAKLQGPQGEVLVANLHLDHQEADARLQQIRVFTAEIKKIWDDRWPLLISGDFNEGPEGAVYRWVMEQLPVSDPWKALGHPEQSSHHRFSGDTQSGERIDWILASPHFEVQEIFFDTQCEGGIYASDHFPLFFSATLPS